VSNRAAFSREDVADAERGAPSVALDTYAAARGLRFLDHATVGGYRAALPCDPQWQWGVMQGWLPGGQHGILAHEALGIPCFGGTIEWSGEFHGVRIDTGERITVGDVVLSMIPVVDLFTGWRSDEFVIEPARAPCTVAAVRVPETTPVVPFLRIDRRDEAPPFDFGNLVGLEELGFPGWRVQSDPPADFELLQTLLADPVGAVLHRHAGDGLFQVVVAFGTLVVRRNGYLADAGELDELAQTASAIADRLRQICLERVQPQPFERPLPQPTWHVGIGEGPRGFRLDDDWKAWALTAAANYGLTLEDGVAYHRAFPSLPVPGFARVVLNGPLPALGRTGRLVVHNEPGGSRPAVLVPAPPGLASSVPDGDRVDTEPPVKLEVRDGLAAVWSLTSYWGNYMAGDVDAFLANAARVMR
jgi:hypothetical protein